MLFCNELASESRLWNFVFFSRVCLLSFDGLFCRLLTRVMWVSALSICCSCACIVCKLSSCCSCYSSRICLEYSLNCSNCSLSCICNTNVILEPYVLDLKSFSITPTRSPSYEFTVLVRPTLAMLTLDGTGLIQVTSSDGVFGPIRICLTTKQSISLGERGLVDRCWE